MGDPSEHRVCTAQYFYWKPLSFQLWLVLHPEKECYMLQTFRKVAQNIPEYAKIVWVDSNKNSWGTLVSTVCVLPKIPIENP